MKTYKHPHSFFALVIELFLTACICVTLAVVNINIVHNQVSDYLEQISVDYGNLSERYISVFKVLAAYVEERIQADPSFTEMQDWLQSKDAVFADAVGKDVSAALGCGMNGHLAKPIDVVKLYATIAKVLGKEKKI